MASPSAWLEVLSWIKAFFDASTLSADVRKAYRKHRAESDTIRESVRISAEFSTYSEEEVREIEHRLQDCRRRFIAEGSGKRRSSCLCSVLEDIKNGNGGVLPAIDDWKRIYDQLCGSKR